ncbi:hypothetical protein SNE40_006764 [Patella caerulea]|uniref:Palmitoyltransferase n=1 Tax=Patella caerulea TaxID=87958 RepID=A0AAN8Q6R0_PATCE
MDVRNRSTNLTDKLTTHYESGKKKSRLIPSVGFLNRCAPLWYIVVIMGVAYWGISDALPSIYGKRSVLLLNINTCLCYVIFIEVMINWMCIHLVDSSYKPHIHGTKQTEDNGSDAKVTIDVSSSSTDNGRQSKFNYKIYVASGVSKTDGSVQRTAYPYWSWVPCLICQKLRPPRCHHCTLCGICVLKRDHHCYFARACVGINNQRHFTVFLFWALFGTVYSSCHMVLYFFGEVLPVIKYIDIVPPIAFVRALFGYQDFVISFLMLLAWGLLAFTVLTWEHFKDMIFLINKSTTSFEHMNEIRITDSRTLQDKLYSVFGHYWVLNFFVPVHMFFKPIEDPLYWPSIKL